MKRARQPAQKEARRNAILTAGWTLFQTERYAAINMSRVAQAAGVAKGTLYLYFKTKEELFLAIMTEQFPSFTADVAAWVGQLPAGIQPKPAGEMLARFLSGYPHLMRLMALTPGILEHNADPAGLRRYKETTLREIGRVGPIIETYLSFLPTGSGPQFMIDIYTLIIGVSQITDLPPQLSDLIAEEPHLRPFGLELESYLAHMIGNHLKGIAESSKHEDNH